MSLISTAISGLRITQLQLSTTGHNIVNADTEGYSRQTVSSATSQPIRTGVGFIGTGVVPTQILRNSEKFLVDQVSKDISMLSDLDSYLTNITQMDNLFAGDKTNLNLSINKFFDAVNEAVNDPGSLLGRQLLLTETRLLVDNFRQVDNRLATQNTAINTRLNAIATNVSGLGQQIASLNKAISEASGGGTRQLPNDLLDKRDQLLRDLSQYVSVASVERPDGTVDVSIGEGQPLVNGYTTRELVTVPGKADPLRRELAFVSGKSTHTVSNLLTGGELGGLMRFRNEALDPAFNAMGRLALAITDNVNQQHKLGIDLEGNLGKALFTDINAPALMQGRIREYAENSPSSNRSLSVSIDDVSALTTSDYELNFSGPGGRYAVIRASDGKLMAQGMLGPERPQSISVDGFSINLNSGDFQNGDRFRIQPARSAAGNLQALIKRPEEFAFASPIRTSSVFGNQGGAFLVAGEVSSVLTASFTSDPGTLSPPIIIRFTSPTTYDVLDYSNPANPVPLNPPLMNQVFTPGTQQAVFPDDPGGTTVSSLDRLTDAVQTGATNGFAAENISVQTTDPLTGFIRSQSVDVSANQSARDIAVQLNALDGVKANASSLMLVSGFPSTAVGAPMGLTLNGVDFLESDDPLPNPLSADFLRDRINGDPELKRMGISASSDGQQLSIRSSTGEDLRISFTGDGALEVRADRSEPPQVLDALVPEYTIGGRLDVQLSAGTVLTSDTPAGLFGTHPEALSNYMGYQVMIGSGGGSGGSGGGEPQAGDSFLISYNSNGSADNRNGLAMLGLGSANLLSDGNLSLQGAYGQMVEELAILTSQVRLSHSASESMLRQSMDALASVSGVNLEEEAARLIQFEQQYNASARLIALARDLFDTLLNM